MPITPADLRRMLQADAVNLTLCGLLFVAGIMALAMAALFRRRAAPLLWIAAFSYLYGFRLLIGTGSFRLYVDAPRAVWDYMAAAITYTVPIPIALFARLVFPAWHRFWTWGAAGLTAFAVYAIASDAMLGTPFSATVANNLIAIGFFLGVLAWLLRPGVTGSRELQTVRVGALAVSLTAVADNLRGLRVVAFPGPNLEPFGFTVFVACLGTVAAWRVFADAQRLVAINRELDIARQIQSSILPQSMPRVSGLTIAARYRPMTSVAGDFYDFLELDAKRLGILIADVSGHGVPAALIASMVKVALAAQRDHADSPAAVLAGMNDVLCGRLAGQYVTAAYLFVYSESQLIRYGAAGHPPMLRSGHAGRFVDEVEHNGLILGFSEHQSYKELETSLRPDDRFLLYTDGLIEASNADDDLFGLERLKVTFAAGTALGPDRLADALLTAIDGWTGLAPSDDLTLVVADWAGQS